MYAVIASGGKQQRVESGQRLTVELLGKGIGDQVSFVPLLVVDGETVHSGGSVLSGAVVSATIVGEAAGPKVTGFKYKPKSNNRVRFGHRQHYHEIEITGIALESGKSASKAEN